MNLYTILFVDNDKRFLQVRKEFLEAKGYRVLTGYNPEEAREWLERDSIDLAILDIRLKDDADDMDISGLLLAQHTDPAIPKIFLTGFPTWEAVRDAFGSHLNGLPLAVDFVAKKEGPEALLRAVEWALNRSPFQTRLLEEFEAPNRMALSETIEDLGAEEAATRLRESFETTAIQLRTYRDQEIRRANQYHNMGLFTAVIGIVLVITGIVLIFFKQLAPTAITIVVGAFSQAASALFFRQQKHAHQQVSDSFKKLNEINNLGNLLNVCDTLVPSTSREEYKKKILDKVIDKWLVSAEGKS